MKKILGGVCAPMGFTASGVAAGLKQSGNLDLGLIYSENIAYTAAVYTKNSIQAAPLQVSKKHLVNNEAQAILVNSGNANCMTGKRGYDNALLQAAETAKRLRIQSDDVVVASTGIIGEQLPIDKIIKALPQLIQGLSQEGGSQFAQAIFTTDTTIKEVAYEFVIDGKRVRIGGCAKGSGMIAPNMATMLSFITSDVAIEEDLLKQALVEAIQTTFNCITVDGCMSTNDMVVLMTNGASYAKKITNKGKEYEEFVKVLSAVCLNLAVKIVKDGEGATKFVKISIQGAATFVQAREIGLAVANSPLVKTAVYGENPNWGRVAQAVGALSLPILENEIKIEFTPFNKEEITITVTLSLGAAHATVYTSDLSPKYVKINAEYT